MQFVKDGPDIPERLLQAHEEGRVVFFCGAGISYPAGLPGFGGLVKQLYEAWAPVPNPVQKAAIKAEQFDTAIGLLESDVQDGRHAVRGTLANVLKPNLSTKSASRTHESLLTLGKTRAGKTQLVTTNFDRVFEEVIKAKGLSVPTCCAPFLPVPKAKWDALVYLHGRLEETPTNGDLDRLVVSSGDFGLAYLNERWAARFVSELFRNFTVCFVGYSINDPVLRYMMDALAADRLLGESPPEMFAFGSAKKRDEDRRRNEWKAKNVVPILYRETKSHSHLHKTLRAWADTYRDGVRGKERIVDECASILPTGSTKQDDYVGRLLWAISDESGLPAKRFAEYSPTPSFEWIEPFVEARFEQADLVRFGVVERKNTKRIENFSLTHRPSPYELAPYMSLAQSSMIGSNWDAVMTQIARWLTRHLGDPRLLLWVAKRAGRLHPEFKRQIEWALDFIRKQEADGTEEAKQNLLALGESAVPGSALRALWRLLLAGRIKANTSFDLYEWRGRFASEGLTASIRMELRRILSPYVAISEPFVWPAEGEEIPDEEASIKKLVDWEIVLSTNFAHSAFKDFAKSEKWLAALPELLEDFNYLLRDTLDLSNELGGADEDGDKSYLHQPSIQDHPQNRDFRDWTILIELTRDAWLATAAIDTGKAASVAERWFMMPYPLFRRLAFFAATHHEVISTPRAVNWLLSKECWWLWSVETERESFRLLVSLADRASADEFAPVEAAILRGPPRDMYRKDLTLERWANLVDREIWLRLAKAAASGRDLSDEGARKLTEISTKNPGWVLSPDQREEFPIWSGGGDWGDAGDEWRKVLVTPRRRRELVAWLREHPATDDWQSDDWQERCRKNFATTACALVELAIEGEWPVTRWQEALQAWSEESLHQRAWRYIAPTLVVMPTQPLQELAHSVSRWLDVISKEIGRREDVFFRLCDRILEIEADSGVVTDEPVMWAINHPVGNIAQAMLHWWFRRDLEDDQLLPEYLIGRFSRLCDTNVGRFRAGRIILASRVVTLFRVDPEWTRGNLLSLFDWQNSEIEALSAWEGFLWSPRLYPPLLEETKKAFLETARHYELLRKYESQYASVLAIASLERGDTFTNSELAAATAELPADGLSDIASTLVRALESAGEQKVEYWDNRVSVYLKTIWPKSKDVATPRIAEHFAHLCIAAGVRFPEAFKQLESWVNQPSNSDFICSQLNESGLCTRYPEVALNFLSKVMGEHVEWVWRYTKDCLKQIESASPTLANAPKFVELVQLIRQRGQVWP